MCLKQILAGALIVYGSARAAEPPGYYDAAQGKTGAELRAALHAIIRNHHSLPYSGSSHPNTADAIRDLDQDPANTNNVLCIYSRYSIVKTNIGSTAGTWDREHRWCNSYGLNSVRPSYTDIHNLCAEEAIVNTTRNNNFYDVSNPLASGYRIYTNAAAGVTWSKTSLTWEPPDLTKGDVARAIIYMAVRYTGDVTNEPHLLLTDATNLIVSGSTYMGRFTTLLKWHFQDPVGPEERLRNDIAYSYQTNRNPFIDHPEWVAAAFVPPLTITSSGQTVTLSWTNDYTPSLVLEGTAAPSSAWTQITNTPGIVGNSYSVTLPLESGAHFYRLRLN
jgi:endonuclease I